MRVSGRTAPGASTTPRACMCRSRQRARSGRVCPDAVLLVPTRYADHPEASLRLILTRYADHPEASLRLDSLRSLGSTAAGEGSAARWGERCSTPNPPAGRTGCCIRPAHTPAWLADASASLITNTICLGNGCGCELDTRVCQLCRCLR